MTRSRKADYFFQLTLALLYVTLLAIVLAMGHVDLQIFQVAHIVFPGQSRWHDSNKLQVRLF